MARVVVGRRRRIAARNLEMALPEFSPQKRNQLLRAHFHLLGESFMDELWMTSAPSSKLRGIVVLENAAALQNERGAILLMPHFIGMNIAGAAIANASAGVMALYRPMRNKFWDDFFSRLRRRHGVNMVSAKDANALRRCVSHLRGGGKLIYLPDIDAKRGKDSVFAPFLAVQNAATYGNIGRIAKAGAAQVLPCLVTMSARQYRVKICAPMACGIGKMQNAAAINAMTGEHARENPAAYYWLHRRFKTRPEGEAYPYHD